MHTPDDDRHRFIAAPIRGRREQARHIGGLQRRLEALGRHFAEELAQLRALKLGIVYLGLESGDPVTLERMHKGATVDQMVEARTSWCEV